jgi:hypothetical protein
VLALELALVLAVVVAMIGGATPSPWVRATFGARIGDAHDRLTAALRTISATQRWAMYAPNPPRSQAYLRLTAIWSDGATLALEESAIANDSGWTRHFVWHKTLADVWRHYATMHPRQPNEHRTWYLRAVCVREARRHGRAPAFLDVELIRRVLTPPAEVARGAPDLGPKERVFIQRMSCAVPIVQQMVEEDRARRGGA